MPKRRARVVERASKSAIQQWVDDYELPDVRTVLDEALTNKIQEAMVRDFVAIATEALVDGLLVTLGTTPGELLLSVGHTDSPLIPHTVEAKYTLKDLANDILGEFRYQDADDLSAWRKEIATLLDAVDKAIAELNG